LFARLRAERYPGKPAVIHAPPGSVLSFGQLESRANQLAHLLRSAGVQQRDHIALFMENGVNMLVWEAAAERARLYYTLINTHPSGNETAYITVGRPTGKMAKRVLRDRYRANALP
jgi:long-chain acyl-CoA synthetase